MNLAGWIIMGLSVGGVTALFAWSLWQVLRTPGSTEHLHAPGEIDAKDVVDD